MLIDDAEIEITLQLEVDNQNVSDADEEPHDDGIEIDVLDQDDIRDREEDIKRTGQPDRDASFLALRRIVTPVIETAERQAALLVPALAQLGIDQLCNLGLHEMVRVPSYLSPT
ncbi:hypothetical protein [Methylobacterium sp.]|uniref:hypothetical protein n=1 Tax=Methylobacterium sp. TaxID=409 RepID=UPI0025D3246D|nr:hypothetical protein [Methylobacterium sp.]